MDRFLDNREQVLTVSAKWSMDRVLSRRMPGGLITPAMVAEVVRKHVLDRDPTAAAKESYVRQIEAAMDTVDEKLLRGQWNYLTTTPDNPFVILDAPVVMWQRRANGLVSFGVGFHREDVEVFLPVSPTLCQHILPDVQRTRPAAVPIVDEVNAAEASLSTQYCYTNVNCPAVDRVVQKYAGTAEMGLRSFTVWHRNYDDTFYDHLLSMDGGRLTDTL
ncbi:MAG: hypothetical protein ACP5E5_02600 [Acidobacteriaceae bacterium]